MALRFALLLANRPEDLTRKFKLIDGSEISFEDVKSHLDDLKTNRRKAPSIGPTFALLESLGVAFDEKNLLVSLTRSTSSIGIEDLFSRSIGFGTYVEASIFDHSCRPNAATVTNGSELQVRAIRPILLNEPVTINYINCKWSRSERQMVLQDDYYFTCQCVRCEREGDDGEDDSICREIAPIKERLDELYEHHSVAQSTTPWYECFKLHRKLLPLYEKIYGEFHPHFTLELVECLGALSMTNYVDLDDRIRSDRDSLERKLLRAIQVTHGMDHPLSIAYGNCRNPRGKPIDSPSPSRRV